MTTVQCKKCNEILTSKHDHDYKVCGCANQTYVIGDKMGGNNLKYVLQIKEPKQKEIKVEGQRPRRRTTRMSDVQIR